MVSVVNQHVSQRGEQSMTKGMGIVLVSTVIMISTAFAQMAPAKIGDTSKGRALVNDKGMTLYVFDKDKDVPGKSACNGTCAENWPALLASDADKASGDWSIVTRDDGKKMWAYKGRPLYAWKNDKAPGDTDGDGKLNGAWHIATP
jgi:predicted lipoprotein with Yx(FWY)xxD motif